MSTPTPPAGTGRQPEADAAAPSLPRGRLVRAAPLVALAGRTAAEALVGRVSGRDAQWHHARAAERYATVLGRHRGLLMKVGQILSFVPMAPTSQPGGPQDLYQNALARLQDDAPPMSAQEAAAVLTAELGAPPEDLFAEFDPQPLAAASIGQVHAARLADGRRVAVKVQYPGVDEAIRADLANAGLLSTFLQLIFGVAPNLGKADIRGMTAELTARISEEIDYRTEALNQAAFADAYHGHPFIRVPRVVPELSARRVLTMEYADGLRWARARHADPELRDRWGEAIYRFTFGSLRRMHRFNGDPHPGNFVFHPDGTVTFLDYGCVRRFTADQVAFMQWSVQAAVDGDAQALWAGFLDGSMMVRDGAPTPDALLAWFRESLRPCTDPQPFMYTSEHAAAVIRRMFSPYGPHRTVVRKVSMQPHYLLLMRIDLGVTSVLGTLRARANWEAIRREYDCGDPPSTRFGEQDSAYRLGRDAGGATPAAPAGTD
ncbi:MAG TPA: AarF/ABC1/UbiB kinase family protein [Pilimelia sp.]|nr:AarF/ABC1/UbiB kinase family protein [Pilimelia sp.]